MEFSIDEFTIRIHRSTTPESESEGHRRLATYISKICELGKKHMPELLQVEDTVHTTKNKGENYDNTNK